MKYPNRLQYLQIKYILTNEMCPNIFKIETITPVHKTGDNSLAVNFQRIILITNIGKIAETVITRWRTICLERNDVLSKKQFGFRGKKSAQDVVKNLITKIQRSLDKKNNNSHLCQFRKSFATRLTTTY